MGSIEIYLFFVGFLTLLLVLLNYSWFALVFCSYCGFSGVTVGFLELSGIMMGCRGFSEVVVRYQEMNYCWFSVVPSGGRVCIRVQFPGELQHDCAVAGYGARRPRSSQEEGKLKSQVARGAFKTGHDNDATGFIHAEKPTRSPDKFVQVYSRV